MISLKLACLTAAAAISAGAVLGGSGATASQEPEASVSDGSSEAVSESESVSDGISSEASSALDGTESAADGESFDFGQWLGEVFTPEVIASIVSCVTAVAALLKMASSIKALAKKHGSDLDDVVDVVHTATSDETAKAIKELVQPIQEDVAKMSDTMSVFAQILALEQENSPEARLAILDLIKQLGALGKDVQAAAEQSQKAIEEQEKAKEEKKEANAKALADIKAESYDGTSI